MAHSSTAVATGLPAGVENSCCKSSDDERVDACISREACSLFSARVEAGAVEQGNSHRKALKWM